MSYRSELTRGLLCRKKVKGESLQEVNTLSKYVESCVPYDILACELHF